MRGWRQYSTAQLELESGARMVYQQRAIDPSAKSALMVSGDGQGYQWNFTSNTLSQSTRRTL